MTVKKVVTIGGETGQFALLAGLRDLAQIGVVSNLVVPGGIIHHHPEKLASVIVSVLNEPEPV